MDLTLRAMTDADLPEVERLENSIFSDPWPLPAFEEHLDGDEVGGLVAETGSRMVAYACFRFECGEIHLTNMAVDPEYRRKSIAKQLLAHILGLARDQECELILLEVRVSNETARRFYEACGFATVDRCRRYYERPVEDALVMMRRVDATPGDK
jgi:ribosomal-protein-alanine N-acetyltransferase